mgnify:CR=1 FL=1
MKYIVLIGTKFDEKQMQTALELYQQLIFAEFICMSGWELDFDKLAVWQEQRRWLLDNDVTHGDIACPDRMSWPGSMSVHEYGRALTVYDQLICTACLTTDDVLSKGELFFVGPSELRELVLTLASYIEIPRIPALERCEYHVTGSSSQVATEVVQESLNVLNGEKRVYTQLFPLTSQRRRLKTQRWLEQHCA